MCLPCLSVFECAYIADLIFAFNILLQKQSHYLNKIVDAAIFCLLSLLEVLFSTFKLSEY